MPAPESNSAQVRNFFPVFPSIFITITPQILKSPFVFISAISDLLHFASLSIPKLELKAGVISETAANFQSFSIQLPGCVPPSHVIVS